MRRGPRRLFELKTETATKSNRSAIGARVTVHSEGRVQVQEVMGQSSYVFSNDPRLQFGLGSAEIVDIEVR